MSIATELDALNDNILDAYTAISTKGGTVPAQKNTANLDTAIASIPSGGGGTPSTPTITSATYANSVITITGTNFDSNSQVKLFNRAYDRWDTITPTSSDSTTITIPLGSTDYGYYSRVMKVVNAGLESNVKFLYGEFAAGLNIMVWYTPSNSSPLPLSVCGDSGDNLVAAQNPNVAALYTMPRSYTFQGLSAPNFHTYATFPSNSVRGIEFNPSLTSLESLGSVNLLGTCRYFNQPLGLANLTKLMTSGGSFLGGALAFNSPLDMGAVTEAGYGFLMFCQAFNQPIDTSKITSVGNSFLWCCSAFDQPVKFNGLTSNGNNFMKDCTAFSSDISFENCTLAVGSAFMHNTANLRSLTIKNTTVSGTAATSLSMAQYMGIGSPAYQYGVTINGDSSATDLMTALPNVATSNGYRNLIAGTITT